VEGVVTQEEVSYPVRLSSQMIRDEQFLGLWCLSLKNCQITATENSI
jgi:hypothetical protein